MAIEYSKVGWDVAPYKYANPDNMDKMDTGIKAAVDAVNALESMPSNLARNGYGENSGGANIWDEKYKIGYWNEGGSGEFVSYANSMACDTHISVKASTQYCMPSLSQMYVVFYDSSKTKISYLKNTFSFTTPSNCAYLTFYYPTYGATYNHNIYLIEGTSGSYVPYYESNKTLTTEVAEMENLKVLGWTIPMAYPGSRNYVDSSRMLHVKVGRVDLGQLTYTKYSVTEGTLFRCNVTNMKSYSASNTVMYCAKYSTVAQNLRANGTVSGTAQNVDIIDNSYSDASAFKSAMQGTYLWYELSTEIVIPCDGSELVNDQECLKYLGWTVPKQLSVKNVAKNGGGLVQRVGRVDLGTLSWTAGGVSGVFGTTLASAKSGLNAHLNGYTIVATVSHDSQPNMSVQIRSGGVIYIKNTSYTDATAFRAAMSGVYLYYELSSAVEIGEGNEAVKRHVKLCEFTGNYQAKSLPYPYTSFEQLEVLLNFSNGSTKYNLGTNRVYVSSIDFQRIIVAYNDGTVRKGEIVLMSASSIESATISDGCTIEVYGIGNK